MQVSKKRKKKSYFHCHLCGAIFLSDLQLPEDILCIYCGKSPLGDNFANKEDKYTKKHKENRKYKAAKTPFKEPNSKKDDLKPVLLEMGNKKSAYKHGAGYRKNRKKNLPAKLLLLLLLLGSSLFYYYWYQMPRATVLKVNTLEEKKELSDKKISGEKLADDIQLFRNALPLCRLRIMQYLREANNDQKAQHVYQASKLMANMKRYYKHNFAFPIYGGDIKMRNASLIKSKDNKQVIGTVCEMDDGRQFEVVFIKQGDEWLIDWPFLVRYSSETWELFNQYPDGQIAEFRLLMRVRDYKETTNEKKFAVFYKPSVYVDYDYTELRLKGVEVQINKKQYEQIKHLLAEESLETDNSDRFLLGRDDPPGYHRVRAKIRVVQRDGFKPHLELDEILAFDWRGFEE